MRRDSRSAPRRGLLYRLFGRNWKGETWYDSSSCVSSWSNLEDSIDFRMDRKAVSSLDDQRANSKTWKELGGSGDTFVTYTTKDAVRLIQQKYKGAEVLVIGSGFLASNVLQILQSSGLRI